MNCMHACSAIVRPANCRLHSGRLHDQVHEVKVIAGSSIRLFWAACVCVCVRIAACMRAAIAVISAIVYMHAYMCVCDIYNLHIHGCQGTVLAIRTRNCPLKAMAPAPSAAVFAKMRLSPLPLSPTAVAMLTMLGCHPILWEARFVRLGS